MQGFTWYLSVTVDEFLKYFKHIKELKFEDEPNYEYLHQIFNERLAKEEAVSKITFDWLDNKVHFIIILDSKYRTGTGM